MAAMCEESEIAKDFYLSAILDLYDRRIIAYKIGDNNNNELVFTTFDEATSLYPNAKPIFHSDRGFQYTNKAFHQKLVGAIENYIHFYNTRRYQKRLNCMTPCEYYFATAA